MMVQGAFHTLLAPGLAKAFTDAYEKMKPPNLDLPHLVQTVYHQLKNVPSVFKHLPGGTQLRINHQYANDSYKIELECGQTRFHTYMSCAYVEDHTPAEVLHRVCCLVEVLGKELLAKINKQIDECISQKEIEQALGNAPAPAHPSTEAYTKLVKEYVDAQAPLFYKVTTHFPDNRLSNPLRSLEQQVTVLKAMMLALMLAPRDMLPRESEPIMMSKDLLDDVARHFRCELVWDDQTQTYTFMVI